MVSIPGNLGDLLKTAQKLQQDFGHLQEEIKNKEVEASAGGGMVTVRVNGKQEILAVTIDRIVVNPDDIEMLQDLVKAATNEAMRKSKDLIKEEVTKLTGGFPIPGFNL